MVIVARVVVALVIMAGVVFVRCEFGVANWGDIGIGGGFESFG